MTFDMWLWFAFVISTGTITGLFLRSIRTKTSIRNIIANERQIFKIKTLKFLYNRKLFGVHKRCWMDVVLYGFGCRSSYRKHVKYKTNCGSCDQCDE